MRLRGIPAILALVGMSFPCARVLAVSVHLSADFEHAQESHDTEDLDTSFHGHHHAEGERDHQHPLIGFDFFARRADLIEGLIAPASRVLMLAQASSTALSSPLSRSGPRTNISDHGPPGLKAQKSILRI